MLQRVKFFIKLLSERKRIKMKKFFISLYIVMFIIFGENYVFSQEIINSGDLSVTVLKTDAGAKISSIKKGDMELLDTEAPNTFFTLFINDKFLTSVSGWDSVLIANDGTTCVIQLLKPTVSGISEDLKVMITLQASGHGMDMDLNVAGLGTSTLTEAHFPYLNIKAEGNDYFFIPRYSGKLYKNPKENSINNTLNYPRGWSATMQFCAYYNENYGIYFGTHDPKATRKDFIVSVNNSNGLKYENFVPIPNKTLPGNDWEYSGVFRFEVFEGDWYDAALIYKKWASNNADFWPQDTPQREARQNAIGSVAAWVVEWGNNLSPDKFFTFQTAMGGIPIGLQWYNWMANSSFDEDYPFLLPEYDGMTDFVHNVQKNGDIFVMPYTNGRLFDQTLPQYPTQGKPYATKDANGNEYTQTYNNRIFSVMCPTQTEYQDILIDQIPPLMNRIGCSGVYIDQVCASSPKDCMDTTHHHAIGGGTIWRDGYKQLLEREHETINSDSNFITSEGACDFLADEVDGFLTLGWMASNMVPAFQAVYGGKVQLFARDLGYDYNVASFYHKLGDLFVNGIQPGWFSLGVTSDQKGLSFAKAVSGVRHKLKDFLSFGTLLRPISIDLSSVPMEYSYWKDHNEGKYVRVDLSIVQYSLWKNKQENKAALVFTNVSMKKSAAFTLDFDGESRGLYGNLKVQKVTADTSIDLGVQENSFTMDISMPALDVVAYIIEPDTMVSGINNIVTTIKSYELSQNYPNPFNPLTTINFSLPKSGMTELSIYNVLGQKVATVVKEELEAGDYKFRFDGSNLSSGIYFYKFYKNVFI